MGTLARIMRSLSYVSKAAVEGAFRPGPYFLPISGGWLPDGAPINWWQTGMLPQGTETQSAIVEACVSAYSQTVAMCPGDHWRANDKGGRDRVTNSALCRILRQPNDYQSISDFLLNAVRSLYLQGNAFALCLRNNRFEIDELHLMHPYASYPVVAATGDIFYTLGGNMIVTQRMGPLPLVPARDVLHIKLHTPRHPLFGVSPIMAAWLDIMTNGTVKNQQLNFYGNQSKPGFVLSTDLLLEKDQVDAARDRWEQHSKGIHAGGTVILNGGLKPVAIPTITGRDAQLAEVLKYTDQDIALAFRVPLQILGVAGTTYGSTETLMQAWISTGLGFCLNHVEEAFDLTFDLAGQPDEYVEFNTTALVRSAFDKRIEALSKGVLGGIFSPNEARNMENLDDVKFGDEPRVQQQLVPLSAASAIPAKPPGRTSTQIPPSPSAPSAPGQPGAPGGQTDEQQRTLRNRAASYRKLERSVDQHYSGRNLI